MRMLCVDRQRFWALSPIVHPDEGIINFIKSRRAPMRHPLSVMNFGGAVEANANDKTIVYKKIGKGIDVLPVN